MITPDHAARKRHKRTLLQLRIKRQQESEQARLVACRILDGGATRLSRLPPPRVLLLVSRYAGRALVDERFDWTKVPGSHCAGWEVAEDRDQAFVAAMRLSFGPDERVALVFHTSESALVMSCSDACRFASGLLPLLHGTLWVVALRDNDALVEVSFIDRQVCRHSHFTGHGHDE